VGKAAPNASRIRFNGSEFEATSAKDTAISLIHNFIALVCPLLLRIKTVGIFHDKFSAAHYAEPRPDLIPEFGLDLVEIDGHLPVGMDFFPHQIGDHFFMGRAQTSIPIVAILKPQEFPPIVFPPATFLP
jgi:hypothetical protein